MLRVRPTTVDGRLAAPGSKSHTHRAYILGALSGNGLVRGALQCDDTDATLGALRGLGCLVTTEADGLRVGGVLRGAKKPLDARESGTTLRLLACVAALVPQPTTLQAGPGLTQRPIEPLLDALRQLGASAESTGGRAPVRIRGPLRGGECRLPGDVSSQFVSGLLLALPLAQVDSRVHVTTPLASRPYVDVTLALLRHHGVTINEHGIEFLVPAQQRVRQKPYTVPGDYSSAAFLFAAAAVAGGRVTLSNLLPDEAQGDRAILDHLRSFGCRVSRAGDQVTVDGGSLAGCDVDVRDTPDLFPILCTLAACARGASTIRGAPQLRLKESDRIEAMRSNLERFGVRCEALPDGLRVHGGAPIGATVQSFHDHRVAMALMVLGLRATGETRLEDPHVVDKSYPRFGQDLQQIAREVSLA